MFDGLAAAGLHDYGQEERELLWAACLLHDIGVAVNYDDHHRHSHYLTPERRPAGLHAARADPDRPDRPLPPQGRALDASELGDLAEPGDEHRLQLLCGVIRLAEQLERSRDRAITDVRVSANGRRVAGRGLRPVPRRDRADLGGTPNADLLAEAVGRDVAIDA